MKRKAVGILPNPKWLTRNGYNGLARTMCKHPEAFAHIQQEWKGGHTLEEHVATAERLEKKHGRLPNSGWLEINGYNGLAQTMRKHPEAFAHIQQEWKGGHTLEEHVATAERLEKEHGRLPSSRWLQDNGHRNLDDAMRRHPEAFAHIQQEWKGGHTLEEHVVTAARLERQYGQLPNHEWLVRNGYGGLVYAMRKSPQAFQGVSARQKRKHQTWKEHVAVAQHLQEQMGYLPNIAWLQAKGFGALVGMLQRRPDLFNGIKRLSKKGRTPEEWVIVAKQVAKQHHGRLPGGGWLDTHNLSGLARAMRRHPSLFARIPQAKRWTRHQ